MSSTEDERRLAAILKMVEPMIDRCEETMHNTSRNNLYWLKSVKLNSPTQEPFTLVSPTAANKYQLLYKKLLAFLFCMYRLDEDIWDRLLKLRLRPKLISFFRCNLV